MSEYTIMTNIPTGVTRGVSWRCLVDPDEHGYMELAEASLHAERRNESAHRTDADGRYIWTGHVYLVVHCTEIEDARAGNCTPTDHCVAA